MERSGDSHAGGIHPESASLKGLFDAAGLVAPHTRKPFTEAMLFGIGGGIGLSYYVFRWKEGLSTFFVSGRHLLQDNLAFLRNACRRLGIGVKVRETAGARAAERNLRAELDAGHATIAWVDLATLPYSGLPESLQRQTYHVVVVYGLDDEKGEARIGDLPVGPIVVSQRQLANARAAIRSQKNRLLSLDPRRPAKQLAAAIRLGIRACCEGLLKGRSWNTRLEAIRRWGDLVADGKSNEGWPTIFPRGSPLFLAHARAYVFIELYGTGRGLLRGLYSDFLEQAGGVLRDPRLGELSKTYLTLARQWSELARSFLPDDVRPFATTRRLLDQFEATWREHPGSPELSRIVDQLRGVRDRIQDEFPLGEEEVDTLRSDLRRQLYAIHEGEARALTSLQTVVQ